MYPLPNLPVFNRPWSETAAVHDGERRATFVREVDSTWLFTRYDGAVEQVGNEVAPLGHGPGYDGGGSGGENVLEEPYAGLAVRHADAGEILLAVETAIAAAVR